MPRAIILTNIFIPHYVIQLLPKLVCGPHPQNAMFLGSLNSLLATNCESQGCEARKILDGRDCLWLWQQGTSQLQL